MADEDRIAPIESRAVVELVDRLRESYNEGQDDGMSNIEHPWCPRCGVLDGPLVPGEDECGVCYEEDGVNETVEYVVWAADHRGAVEAIRTLRAYLAKPEGDGPIRYIEALALCDTILLGRPTPAPAEDTALNVLARVIENRHGTLPGIGDTLREALAELRGPYAVTGLYIAKLRKAGEKLADAVRGLDSYAALGGAPMERTDRADAALEAWALASREQRAPTEETT